MSQPNTEPEIPVTLVEIVADIQDAAKHRDEALEAQRQLLRSRVQGSCGHERGLARISLAKVEAAMGRERCAHRKVQP